MKLSEKARAFAVKAHDEINQKRKYTNEPYWVHCDEVAEIVRSVGGDEEMIAAAYLHDTVEDTNVTLEMIKSEFGEDVADLVEMLTDVSRPTDGNRAQRKAIDRAHSAKASPRAKTIKLADLISNSRCIIKNDQSFAKVYIKEKELLLHHLKEGNSYLYNVSAQIISDYYLSKKMGT